MWDGPYGEWGSKKRLISSHDQNLNTIKWETLQQLTMSFL